MEARHAHVVQAGDVVAQYLGGEGGFLGHGHIAGAAGGHHDGALAGDRGHVPHDAHPADLVVGEGQGLPHHPGGLGAHAGDEDGLLPLLAQGGGDVPDLRGGLARAVDHLGGTLAQAPVVIHLGEAQVLEGLHLQPQNGLVHRALAVGHLL